MRAVLIFTGLCAVFFPAMIDAKLHIGLVTDKEALSQTNHYVAFRVHGDKGISKWMYPTASGRDFRGGRQMKTAFNLPSVGTMRKVDIKVERPALTIHSDDWKGYRVLISDSELARTWSVDPGWVKTDKIKTLPLKPFYCHDKYDKCFCKGSGVGSKEAFGHYKYEINDCPLSCGYCYKPKSRRDESTSAEGDVTGEEEPTSVDEQMDEASSASA